jgi:hypothetical protein
MLPIRLWSIYTSMSDARDGTLTSPENVDASKSAAHQLQYRVELRRGRIVKVLARAQSSSLARSIFQAACREYPSKNVFLLLAEHVVAKRPAK